MITKIVDSIIRSVVNDWTNLNIIYMKKANEELEESIDRWFKFVEEYNKESTVPLSYVLLPNTNQSYRTCGSSSGCLKLNKRELRKIDVL